MSQELIPHVEMGEVVQQLHNNLEASVLRVRTLLDRIAGRNRRNLEDAVAIGQELHSVKQQLQHGAFGDWLAANFAMSRTEATRYMQVAAYFADKLSTMDNLPPLTVAYLLAQVSTPESVRQAVLTGQIPATTSAVKEAITAEKTEQTSDAFDNPESEGFTDEWIKSQSLEITQRAQSLAREAIEIGKMLFDPIGKKFNVGQMKAWAASEFNMDEQDVSEFVSYAHHYRDIPVENLPKKIMWEIAGTYASWYMERYMPGQMTEAK